MHAFCEILARATSRNKNNSSTPYSCLCEIEAEVVDSDIFLAVLVGLIQYSSMWFCFQLVTCAVQNMSIVVSMVFSISWQQFVQRQCRLRFAALLSFLQF